MHCKCCTTRSALCRRCRFPSATRNRSRGHLRLPSSFPQLCPVLIDHMDQAARELGGTKIAEDERGGCDGCLRPVLSKSGGGVRGSARTPSINARAWGVAKLGTRLDSTIAADRVVPFAPGPKVIHLELGPRRIDSLFQINGRRVLQSSASPKKFP
jgi:hypothetical protein